MFDIFKKIIKKEDANESLPESKEEILDILHGQEKQQEAPDYEEALHYIEEKLEENIEPEEPVQEKIEFKDPPKSNDIIDFYKKRQEELKRQLELEASKDFPQHEIPEIEQIIEKIQQPEPEINLTENQVEEISHIVADVSMEEALHYLDDKISEHETEEQHVQEEPAEEISQSELDEILEEAEYQEFTEGSFADFTEVEEIKAESQEEPQPELISHLQEILKDESLFEEEIQETQEIKEPEKIEEAQQSKSVFGISFAGLKDAISKTSEFFSTNIFSITTDKEEIDDDFLDTLEEKFIRADIGVNTTVYIIERLRERKNQVKPCTLNEYLKEEFKQILKTAGRNEVNLRFGQLNTMLITGVNGAGKTTLIGKLAYEYKLQGKKVLVAAGDTFRAAAEDQLEIWANRAGAAIIRQDGADPASVVFDAIKKAQEENYDILLIDTAGRLHNKFNLMEELGKIKKVIDKEAPESLIESLLVLDATTGQNGLKQAEVFKEAVDLTGVGLTKLDGTAKGGVILGIAKELNLPVKLIGVGEKMEDLKEFNPDDFIEALF